MTLMQAQLFTPKSGFLYSLYMPKRLSKQAAEFRKPKDFFLYLGCTILAQDVAMIEGYQYSRSHLGSGPQKISPYVAFKSQKPWVHFQCTGGSDHLTIGTLSAEDSCLTSKIFHMPLTQPSLLVYTGSIPIQG